MNFEMTQVAMLRVVMRSLFMARTVLCSVVTLVFSVHACAQPGEALTQFPIGQGMGGFSGSIGVSSFGEALANIGDVNGDGVADLAVGGPFDNVAGEQLGSVWILFLDENHVVKDHRRIDSTTFEFPGGLDIDDRFGGALTSVGDLDGNGVPDLAVGASRDDDGGKDRGAVWILFLDEAADVINVQKISATTGGFAGEFDDNDHFGSSLASLGDLNGDGVPDLAVGAPLDEADNFAEGAVWILFLNADGTVQAQQKVNEVEGTLGFGLSPGDQFGSAMTAMGDLNDDGVVELAVSADGQDSPGFIAVLFMSTDGSVSNHTLIDPGDISDQPELIDTMGVSLTAAGDLNDDDVVDLVFGDPDAGETGALWVLFLNANGAVIEDNILAPGNGLNVLPQSLTGSLGISVAASSSKADAPPVLFTGRPIVGDLQPGSTSTIWAILMNPPQPAGLDLQDAIDGLRDGQTLDVPPGLYEGQIDFQGKAITLRAAEGPGVTFLDGNGEGPVVTFGSGEGRDSVLEAFTIVGGAANNMGAGAHIACSSPTIRDCHFLANGSNGGSSGMGGAIRIIQGAPLIENCTFVSNVNGNGGAIDHDGKSNDCDLVPEESLMIINCDFIANMAEQGGAIMSFLNTAEMIVRDCTFRSNSATLNAQPFNVGGGLGYAFTSSDSVLRVENCAFENNIASSGGGLGLGETQGKTVVKDCRFDGNLAKSFDENFGGAAAGVAIGFAGQSVVDTTFVNCEITNNKSDEITGGIQLFGPAALINCVVAANEANQSTGGIAVMTNATGTVMRNCVIANNQAAKSFGGITIADNADVQLVNSIIRQNTAAENTSNIAGGESAIVSYSNIEGGWPGIGNIDMDPMFVDPQSGDYRLIAESPMIDAGHNWGIGPDAPDIDDDDNTSELFPFDFDNNARVAMVDDIDDTGCGNPAVIDIGAFEFQGQPININFADITGDCDVAVEDLIELFASWGDVELNCLADLNVDGVVNTVDLLALLAAWGACR